MKFTELTNQVLELLESDQIKKRNNRPYSKSSKRFYKLVCKVISDESEDFEIKKYKNSWVTELREKLRERGIETVSENQYMTVLQWLFGQFGELGHEIKASKKVFYRISEPDRMIVPETARVFEMIRYYEPKERHKASFKYIVAAVLTAARYSDIKSWTDKNLISDNGNLFIKYVPAKTKNKEVVIPVNELLKSHLNLKGGSLLPKLSYDKLNRDIKTIFNDCGFHDMITRTRNIGEKEVSKEYEMWELMGIHRLRASAITGMLESGMNESEVKSFSGHSFSSKSFDRYVNMSTKHLNDSYNKYQSRF